MPALPDIELAWLAVGRHGAFTRADALRLGFTDRMIVRRLASGAWLAIHSGVYRLAATPMSTLLRFEAATFASPGSVLSGFAAAHVHGFDGCRAVRPEVTTTRTGNARLAGVRVRRRVSVETESVRGLTVTTVPQTLFDLVGRLSTDRFSPILDAVVMRPTTDNRALRSMATQSRARRLQHAELFGALVEDRLDDAGVAESVLELEGLRLLRAGGFDAVPQARFRWWKSGRGRFDCALEHRVLVEFDGRSWHSRVKAFEEDRRRDTIAAANGHQVVRFTATQIRHRPDEVLGFLHDILRHRAA